MKVMSYRRGVKRRPRCGDALKPPSIGNNEIAIFLRRASAGRAAGVSWRQAIKKCLESALGWRAAIVACWLMTGWPSLGASRREKARPNGVSSMQHGADEMTYAGELQPERGERPLARRKMNRRGRKVCVQQLVFLSMR